MTDTAYFSAAQLRATFALRTPDALALARALLQGCSELWTNDGRLQQASVGMALNVID